MVRKYKNLACTPEVWQQVFTEQVRLMGERNVPVSMGQVVGEAVESFAAGTAPVIKVSPAFGADLVEVLKVSPGWEVVKWQLCSTRGDDHTTPSMDALQDETLVLVHQYRPTCCAWVVARMKGNGQDPRGWLERGESSSEWESEKP